MRNDLHKVVTAICTSGGRDRTNHWIGKVPIDPDNSYENEVGGFRSNRASIIWRRYNSNNGTAIFRKILRRNVGRLWDEVYSEFCAVSKKAYYRQELHRALDALVTVDCYTRADGVVVEYNAGVIDETRKYDYVNGKRVEVPNPGGKVWLAVDTPVRGLYVHPDTGVLSYAVGEKYVDRFPGRYDRTPKEINRINIYPDGRRQWIHYPECDRYSYATSYERKSEVDEWYALEECGRSPRTRFKAWFHYKTTETVVGEWKPLGEWELKNHSVSYRLNKVWKMGLNPYRKYPDGRFDNELPELIPFIWRERRETKTVKRSVNRQQMEEIRRILAKDLESRQQAG